MTAAQTAPETASAPTDAAIVVRGLTKTFGATRALDGFDLTVPRGEVTGFLGPNGAGKSTTIRVLLGLLRATSGRAEVLGMDPWSQAVQIHHRLAYVPGDTNLPTTLGGHRRVTRGGGAAHTRQRGSSALGPHQGPHCPGHRRRSPWLPRSRDVTSSWTSPPGPDPLMEAIFSEEPT